uniref:Uncharacterized protein n=1 Tax=Chromera velia CCMP2878 TaxID=1169474 RepID=A0A0G4I4Q5_9ALVE
MQLAGRSQAGEGEMGGADAEAEGEGEGDEGNVAMPMAVEVGEEGTERLTDGQTADGDGDVDMDPGSGVQQLGLQGESSLQLGSALPQGVRLGGGSSSASSSSSSLHVRSGGTGAVGVGEKPKNCRLNRTRSDQRKKVAQHRERSAAGAEKEKQKQSCKVQKDISKEKKKKGQQSKVQEMMDFFFHIRFIAEGNPNDPAYLNNKRRLLSIFPPATNANETRLKVGNGAATFIAKVLANNVRADLASSRPSPPPPAETNCDSSSSSSNSSSSVLRTATSPSRLKFKIVFIDQAAFWIDTAPSLCLSPVAAHTDAFPPPPRLPPPTSSCPPHLPLRPLMTLPPPPQRAQLKS